MTTKNILDKETGTVQIVELTAEEVVKYETDNATDEQEMADRRAKIDEQNSLKASAKAKLISGEALTEEEANTIVL
tara:strand:+ start:119 stop:346 length:228 start_codon:yes stop_codon:yes gene_type:complete